MSEDRLSCLLYRPETLAWWRDLWHSPMAAEYARVDIHQLYILADLIDRYWSAPSAAIASEIRQHRAAFGLTPIDRRRLQWTIPGEGPRPKRGPQPMAPPTPIGDPRDVLRAV